MKLELEFCIDFDDGSKAECIAMTPIEKDNPISKFIGIPWVTKSVWNIEARRTSPCSRNFY